MKNNDKNVFEPLDQKAYKKRFLLRKHEEHEAEQLIKQFKEADEDCPDESGTPTNERE